MPYKVADKEKQISPAYVTKAERTIALQLKRAGIRVAHLLNQQLGSDPADSDAYFTSNWASPYQ